MVDESALACDCGDDDGPDYSYMLNDLSYQFQYLQQSISDLYATLYKHMDPSTHLPSVSGADQMQKAVDALGLGGSYDVQKRVIYASNGKPSKFVLELTPKVK